MNAKIFEMIKFILEDFVLLKHNLYEINVWGERVLKIKFVREN